MIFPSDHELWNYRITAGSHKTLGPCVVPCPHSHIIRSFVNNGISRLYIELIFLFEPFIQEVWLRTTTTKGMMKLYPELNTHNRTLNGQLFTHLSHKFQSHLEELDLECCYDDNNDDKDNNACVKVTIVAQEPVWTRQYRRRKRQRLEIESSKNSIQEIQQEQDIPILIILLKISSNDISTSASEDNSMVQASTFVAAEWIWGYDRQHFDGFWFHLIRKLDEKEHFAE